MSLADALGLDNVTAPDPDPQSVVNDLISQRMPDVAQNGNVDPQAVVNRLIRQQQAKGVGKPTPQNGGEQSPPDFSAFGVTKDQAPPPIDFSQFGQPADQGAQPNPQFTGGGEGTAASPYTGSVPVQQPQEGALAGAAEAAVAAPVSMAGGVLKGAAVQANPRDALGIIEGLSAAPFNPAGAVNAAAGAIKNLVGAPEESPEQNPVYKAGEAVERVGKDIGPSEATQKAHPIATGVGSGIGAAGSALGLAIADPGAALAGGAAMFGLSSAGDTYDQAIKHGASEATAREAATLSGAANAALGTLPIANVLKPFQAVMPEASGLAMRILAQAAQNGITFAGVGEAQEYLGQQIAKMYDPQAGYSFNTERLISELLAGGALGAIHGAMPAGTPSAETVAQPGQTGQNRQNPPSTGGLPPPGEAGAAAGGEGPEPQAPPGTGGAGAQQPGAGAQQGTPNAEPPPPSPQQRWNDFWSSTPEPEQGQQQGKRWQTLAGVMKAYGFADPDLKNASTADLMQYQIDANMLAAKGYSKDAITAMGPDEMHAAADQARGKGPQADDDEILRRYGVPPADAAAMSGEQKSAAVDEALRNGVRAGQEGPKPGSQEAPVDLKTAADVTQAAEAADQEHTPEQGEANNIPRGHATWQGLDVTIEAPAGGVRRGVADNGAPWEQKFPVAYGYIRGTVGADGDHLDTYVGPNPKSGTVYVLDEKNAQSGGFRQHKAFIGFDNPRHALDAYLGTQGKGAEGVGGMRAMPVDAFKDWLKTGDLTAPASERMALPAPAENGSNAVSHNVSPGSGTENPTAEPLSDIQAQVRDLSDPNSGRQAVWLPPATVTHLQGLGALGRVAGPFAVVSNLDGKGGMLIARDAQTAKQASLAVKNGQDFQGVVGALTGAGAGKTADMSAVVQQRDRAGNVTRERGVNPADIAATQAEFAKPGHTVGALPVKAALDRRAQLVGAEAERAQAPPSPADHAAIEGALRQAGVNPDHVRPADIARAAEISAQEGLSPQDAFPVAVVRSLVEDGHITPQAAKEVLGDAAATTLLASGHERPSGELSAPAPGAGAGGQAAAAAHGIDRSGNQNEPTARQNNGAAPAEGGGSKSIQPELRAGAEGAGPNGAAAAAGHSQISGPGHIERNAERDTGRLPDNAKGAKATPPAVGGNPFPGFIENNEKYRANAKKRRERGLGTNTVYKSAEQHWARMDLTGEEAKAQHEAATAENTKKFDAALKEANIPRSHLTDDVYEAAIGYMHSLVLDPIDALDYAMLKAEHDAQWFESEEAQLAAEHVIEREANPHVDDAAIPYETERASARAGDEDEGAEVRHEATTGAEVRGPERPTGAAAGEGAGRRGAAGEPSNAHRAGAGEPGAEHEGGTSSNRSEPAIEPTAAGQQHVLPGAERISDAELAKRRSEQSLKPKVAQKSADEGLFSDESKQADLVDQARAAKPPPEPEATAKNEIAEKAPETGPSSSKARKAPSKSRPEEKPSGYAAGSNEPSSFIDLGKFETDAQIGREAQAYVAERGRETGLEHLVAFDKDGSVVAHGRGTRGGIGLSPALDSALRDPRQAIVVHHNHPNNTSLSNEDIGMLGLPGQAAIWVHGNGGLTARAALTADARKLLSALPPDEAAARLQVVARGVDSVIERAIIAAIGRQTVSAEESSIAIAHLVATTLGRAGILDYHSNVDASDFIDRAGLGPFLEGSARAAARRLLNEKPPNRDDGRTASLHHPGDLGTVFGETRTAAAWYALQAGNDKESEAAYRDTQGEPDTSGKKEGKPSGYRESAPPFYSAVARAVEGVKQEKASPNQWIGMLKNAPGVKSEEMEWLGLPDWLREHKGPVTKQQIADYVRANEIELQEVQHGDFANLAPTLDEQAQALYGKPFAELDIDDQNRVHDFIADKERRQPNAPKFRSYTLPGGENYRELLLTLPSKEVSAEDFYRAQARGVTAGGIPDFRSSHWDEPNVLAHIRFDDRVTGGKKTLHVAEIQSDWGQSLRKSRALRQLREPQSARKLTEDFFGAKTASVMALPARDAAMLPMLKHDEVRKAVVARVPVNVVDILKGLDVTPDALLRDPSMLSGPRFDEVRGRVALGIRSALSEVGADLRAKLLMSRAAGRDEGVLPALRASDLSAREIVSMLAPQALYHVGASDLSPGDSTASARTEFSPPMRGVAGKTIEGVPTDDAAFLETPLVTADGAIPPSRTARAKSEKAPARVTDLLDWHNRIVPADRRQEYRPSSIPAMPFGTTWHELALKRMLRFAAENGYDRVTWDTGATNAERYDLSKQVGRIGSRRTLTAKDGQPQEFYITAWDPHGQQVLSRPGVTESELAGLVGKELADKIAAAPNGQQNWAGLDLKVGGEGMRGFYDKILPAAANKLVKKFGGKVGRTEIHTEPRSEYNGREVERQPNGEWAIVDEDGIPQGDSYATEEEAHADLDRNAGVHPGGTVAAHSLDITPALRDAAMRQGFALFEQAPDRPTPSAESSQLLPAKVGGSFRPFPGARLGAQAQSYVLARGRATGNEHVVGIHRNGGIALQAEGGPSGISFGPRETELFANPANQMVVHHNHPNNGVFSLQDLTTLASPGMEALWAHGHGGNILRIAPTPLGRRVFHSADYARNIERMSRFVRAIGESQFAKPLMQLVSEQALRPRYADSLYLHMVAEALRRAGLVDYHHTSVFENDIASLELDPYIDGAARAIIRSTLNGFTTERPEPGHDRRTGTLFEHPGDLGAAFERVGSTAVAQPGAAVPDGLRQAHDRGQPQGPVSLAEDNSARTAAGGAGGRAPPGGGAQTATAAPPPGNPWRSLTAHVSNLLGGETGVKLTEGVSDYSHRMRLLQNYAEALYHDWVSPDGSLPDEQQFYTLKRLFPGKRAARADVFNREHFEPLAKFLRDNRITEKQAGDYLYAKHAPERNQVKGALYAQTQLGNPQEHDFSRARRDPNVIGASGMSRAEANDIVRRYENGPKAQAFAELARRVDGIRRFIQEEMLRGGLESQDAIAKWNRTYRHYVPLKEWDDPAEMPDNVTLTKGRGRGDIRGPENKYAFGRRTKADNPLAHLITQAYRTIDRAEKNRVFNAMANALGSLKRAGAPIEDALGVHLNKGRPQKQIDPNTGLARTVDAAMDRFGDNAVQFKRAGEPRYFVFDDRAMADGVRRWSPAALPGPLHALLWLMNKMKSMWTHYSPNFLVRHNARYYVESVLNAMELKESGPHSVSAHARQAFPIVGAATRAIFAVERGEDPAQHTGEMADLMRSYQLMKEHGGVMAMRTMRDIDQVKEDIRVHLNDLRRGAANVIRLWHNAVETMNHISSVWDNAQRLATMHSALQQGKTPQQAALLARDATIDYQFRGLWSNIMGLWEPFFNTALRTGFRLGGAVSRSKIMRGVFFGTLAMGLITSAWNYLVGGKDKDGIPFFDKIPPWERSKSMILLAPWIPDAKGRPSAIKFPFPYNWGGALSMGYGLGNFMWGSEPITTVLKESFLKPFVSMFSEIGDEGVGVRSIMPAIFQPAYDIATNRDWAGRPIHMDEVFQKAPNAYSGKKDYGGRVRTGEGWKDIAETLNDYSGGARNRSGLFDFYPEDIREVLNPFLGTQIGFGNEAYQTGKAIAAGQSVNPTTVPVGRVFFGQDYDAADRYAQFQRSQKAKHPWMRIDQPRLDKRAP